MLDKVLDNSCNAQQNANQMLSGNAAFQTSWYTVSNPKRFCNPQLIRRRTIARASSRPRCAQAFRSLSRFIPCLALVTAAAVTYGVPDTPALRYSADSLQLAGRALAGLCVLEHLQK
jgi:hypothetical protein